MGNQLVISLHFRHVLMKCERSSIFSQIECVNFGILGVSLSHPDAIRPRLTPKCTVAIPRMSQRDRELRGDVGPGLVE